VSSTATERQTARLNARWTADVALALVALVWGATFVIVKRALADISTMYFLAVRFTLASVCMLLIFVPSFRQASRAAVWRGLRGGIAAGVFLWAGYVLQTFGLKYTTAGNSGFLTGLYIVLVPLIGAAVYRRWPQSREMAGIVIATAGMIAMTIHGLDTHLLMNRGDALTVGCAFAFACHLLVLGYFSQREFFPAIALGQIACTAILSTASLFVEHPTAYWSSAVVWAVCVTALLATAVAFALQTWAQQYTTATRTALIFALEPVFALTVAVMVGGERLSFAAVTGGTLILAGILAVELGPKVERERWLNRLHTLVVSFVCKQQIR
jgi:drug/metabolite transporter (DMT)-like permease